MARRADSVRALGQASLACDKPTRIKIKALAEAEGLHVSQWLRIIAERGLAGKSLPMSTGTIAGDNGRTIASKVGEVISLACELDKPNKYYMALGKYLAQLAMFNMRAEISEYEAELLRELEAKGVAKEPQGELRLNEA